MSGKGGPDLKKYMDKRVTCEYLRQCVEEDGRWETWQDGREGVEEERGRGLGCEKGERGGAKRGTGMGETRDRRNQA
eukprot:768259-Hanusia_phi.AAC.4